MKIPLDILMKLLGAVYDPARGALSLSRTTAVTFLTLAAVGAGKAQSTTDLVVTGIQAAAGVGALYARRKDPPVQ